MTKAGRIHEVASQVHFVPSPPFVARSVRHSIRCASDGSGFPWPPPFPPRTPLGIHCCAPLCSPASQVLRKRVTSTDRTSAACALGLPATAPIAFRSAGQPVDLPIPALGASKHAWFFDRAGFPSSRDIDERNVVFQRQAPCRHPGGLFRGSIARPTSAPVANASACPRGVSRMVGVVVGRYSFRRGRLTLPAPSRF